MEFTLKTTAGGTINVDFGGRSADIRQDTGAHTKVTFRPTATSQGTVVFSPDANGTCFGRETSPSNDSEDVNLPLFGAPWSTNSGAVLYSSFKAKWLSLPGAIGTYMAHFMDTNTGVGTGFGARIWASTNTASVGNAFRLSINNGNGRISERYRGLWMHF